MPYERGRGLGATNAHRGGNPPPAADHGLTIAASHGGEHASDHAAPLKVQIDTVIPLPPTLALDPSSDTGVTGDGVTADTTPTLFGTAGADTTITVLEGGAILGTTTAAADGTWSLTLAAALGDGPHSLSATATDADGNTSDPSVVLDLEIDITPPPLTATLLHDFAGQTNDPTLTGLSEAGALITVLDGANVLGTTIAAADGSWTFTPVGLALGAHDLTVTADDADGNGATTDVAFTLTDQVTIEGSDAAETIAGSDGDDVIYGYDRATATATVTGINLTLLNADAGTNRPLDIVTNGVDATHIFVVSQPGRIDVVNSTTGQEEGSPLLDLTGQIYFQGDMGLHGLAFDPDFASNGKFYVIYGQDYGGGNIRQEIWSYTVLPTNPLVADTSSAQLVASWASSTANHRVGNIQFGPDGYLWVNRGDGFNPNDGLHQAQDPFNLQGKILRIDVTSGVDSFPGDPQRNYAIPPDNPFVDGVDGAPEVYHIGLRNPWRSFFDQVTGDFYIADVGQKTWEELNYLPRGSGPANLGWGWNGWEGNDPLNPDGPTIPPDGLTFPVYTYHHDDPNGQYAIIGGYVYRGPSAAMQGEFLFGDFGQGFLFTTHPQGTVPWSVTDWTSLITYTNNPSGETLDRPPSFGLDAEGNLYVVDLDNNLFRLDYVSAPPVTGDNVIHAGDGNDWAGAGTGNDSVTGDAGNDTLSGMEGGDTLEGGAGDDSLIAGAGGDDAAGGDGADTVLGGDGNDLLRGDAGNDAIDGGAGTDIAVFSGNRADYLITALFGGVTTVQDLRGGSPDGLDQLRNVETLRFADGDVATAVFNPPTDPTDGDDFLTGTANKDTIDGLAGNDTITGLAGKDQLYGGDGNDVIDAGPGPNKVTGGAGNDTIDGGTGPNDSAIYSGDRADYEVTNLNNGSILITDLRGGSPDGTDLVKNIETFTFADGSVLFDNLFGPPGTPTEGDDSLSGTSASDTINGLGGNDTIEGFGNKDQLFGGAGDDSIQGGGGNDKMNGGLGADRMVGGPGNETYFYMDKAESPPSAPDIIVDFAPGLDRINLRKVAEGELDFIGHTSSFDGGGAKQVRWETAGPETWIFVDTDGDAVADMQITLLAVSEISASDFLL